MHVALGNGFGINFVLMSPGTFSFGKGWLAYLERGEASTKREGGGGGET